MDRKAFLFALAWGAGTHVLLVVIGHFVEVVADYLFVLGGLAIAVATGLIYARRAERGIFPGAAASAAAAGFVAVALAVLLGDMWTAALVLGPLAAALAGMLGALVEEGLAARRAKS